MGSLVGRTLCHYKILSKLGAGGMGEVYLAADTKLKRRVALKILPAEMANDPERLERFQREAETVAALNHPHIVTLHSLEEGVLDEPADGRTLHFITMELVDGKQLDEVIPAGGLELDPLLELAIPLADALAAAHRKGVVHRDLKPGNVMVANEGRVKVLDFGLAKLLAVPTATEGATEALTQDGTFLGTVKYSSPEQVQGQQVDQRSDVFALGLLLYEMASGERPFAGDGPAQIVSSLLRDEAPSLVRSRPDLPMPLANLVARCLEKNAHRRFGSAAEVRDELRALRGDSVSRSVLPVPFPVPPAAAPPVAKSIAVLPFVNLGSQAEDEYFSDGVSEEILNVLGHRTDLRVAARTSCFAFKGTQAGAREIGTALNVATLLEGSVRRAGNRLRITAQMTDVKTGFQLWSERFDREMDDVFAIQDEIAARISERLELTLAAAVAPGRSTPHLEAYDLYLKARFSWEQRGEGVRRALALFERALEVDPDYPLAHAGLADTFNLLAFYGFVAGRDAIPKAKAAARRALELDDQLAEAHASLALSALWLDWDWDAGRDGLRRALEINPGNVSARHWYGIMDRCWVRANFDEAHRALNKAVEIDPLNAVPLVAKALVLMSAGRHADALECARRTTELHPTSFLAWRVSGLALHELGQFDEALVCFDKALELSHRFAWLLTDTAVTLLACGRSEEAEALQSELGERPYASPVFRSMYSLALKRPAEAIEHLERACEERDPLLIVLRTWPTFDPVRDDPGFRAVLERMAFPT